jgi:hypothetical protein
MKNSIFTSALFAMFSFVTFSATAQSNNQSNISGADEPGTLMTILTAGDISFHDNLTQATFSDTVKQGDTYYFEVVVQNFSQAPMDSVYLKYYLGDDATNFELRVIKPLEPGEAYTLPVLAIATDDFSGSQTLNLELNPNAEKPESDYDNNKLAIPFFVKPTMVSSTEFAELEQQQIYNYPNPVIGSTRFHVNLGANYSQTESIQINILDIRGQVVKSIISSDNNGQGKFNTEIWNAADESGNPLAAGVYFCSIIAQDKDGKINTIAAKSNIQIR